MLFCATEQLKYHDLAFVKESGVRYLELSDLHSSVIAYAKNFHLVQQNDVPFLWNHVLLCLSPGGPRI